MILEVFRRFLLSTKNLISSEAFRLYPKSGLTLLGKAVEITECERTYSYGI